VKKNKHLKPPRASDSLVDLARTLHDEAGMGYRTIAKRLGIRLYTVRDWLRYRRRTEPPKP
jgi:transposase